MSDQNSKNPGWPPADGSNATPGWPPAENSTPAWPPADTSTGWLAPNTLSSTPNSTPGWPPTDSSGGWQQGGWGSAPGSPQGMGWGIGQPWQGLPPAQPKRSNRALLVLGALGLVAIVVAALVIVGAANSGDVTATSSVKPDQGDMVFNDTFADNDAGWWTGNSGSSDYGFDSGAYKISGSGDLIHFVPSPHDQWYRQLSVTMTASQAPGQPDEAGFGAYCVREDYGSETGSSRLAYEFVVMTDGSWSIDRRRGESSTEMVPDRVTGGLGAPAAGTTPITIQAVCATLDPKQTRLILFVNGKQIGEAVDSVNSMPDELWEGGILAASAGDARQTVVITGFVVRNLQK